MGVGALVGIAAGAAAASTAAGVTVAAGAMIGFSVGNSYDNYKEAKEFQESMNQSKNSPTYSFGPISNTKSHQIPIPVAYGRNLAAGNIINQKIHGKNDRYMDLQVGISEGPIESISEIKADDKDVSAEVKLGYRSQTAWSKNEHGQTFPYLAYYSLTLDAEKLKTSGTPTMTAIIKGRHVRVWTGSRWVTKYSNNPVWCVLDFLTNKRFGFGVKDKFINFDSFKEAAEYADEIVDGERRFELDFMIDAKSSALDILNEILSTFRAFLIYSNGQLKLKIDKPEIAAQSFTFEEHIIAESFVRSRTSRKDRYESVIVEYTDPNENFETIGARFLDKSVPGETIKTITLNGVNRFSQAGREARYYQKKSKYCVEVINFKAGINSVEAEVGDKVLITHPRPGWTDKPFRIMEISESENEELAITAVEYNEAIYTDNGIVQQENYGSELENPLEAPREVSDLKVSEYGYTTVDGNLMSNLIVEFSTPDDERFSKAIIDISENGGPYRIRGETEGGSFEIENLKVNVSYQVRVRTVSKYRSITSDGIISRDIIISGKDNKPAAPETLQVAQKGAKLIFKWQEVNEPDVLGYEIRKGTDWGNGEVLGTKLTGDRWTSENEIDGTHMYMIKTIDRVRQYSSSFTSAIFEVSGTGQELNIIIERNELDYIDNATLDNIDNINGKIAFFHMYNLEDLAGYNLDDWPDIPAFANGLPDYDFNAEYMTEIIDTVRVGRTDIRLKKDWFFQDSGLSLLSFPNRGLDDFPNNSLDNPPAIYETEIYVRFSDDNVEWSDWQTYMTGEYKFRYCQFKFTFQLETETAEFELNEIKQFFDVPDLELEIDNLSVPVGGKTINYSDYGIKYYEIPRGYNYYLLQDGSTMKYADFQNKTIDSVDVVIKDINNNDVGGTAEKIIIEGY
ncbi:phage tail protein [Halanaerobium salsuginis]|uniref:Putative phage tail protein n=1 Tax=Halanaerobium salsuginis TaxID=29563 RepID=A0A1I4LRH3_9FIRM|nr:phage tail protein [Halanaerobium salsuginis]SFL93535.1 Putative phage tail protein [Halanaerobium salsuginis]